MQLSHKVAVYVPSTEHESTNIGRAGHQARARSVARVLSTLYGGATVTDGQGSWINDDGDLITESVKIVNSFTSEVSTKGVLELAKGWCQDWTQDSVLVEIDGTAHLVGSK